MIKSIKLFKFIHIDHNGCIRIDYASKIVITGVLSYNNKFNSFLVNDPDCDKYRIITPAGFVKPHHYLITAMYYFFKNRILWHSNTLAMETTYVTSSAIHRASRYFHYTL
ncbi:hypothetical protein [Candidatus Blochmannia ocreatus (nom. nud.)]|uniref:Uncharacterized protein n=1 Tax=Candidatus Blochmannia ocreatus (nom. nud.) TaxID=251538 RepID=A0ABY4STT1_9ENTR|nr:hypothetical protein [Candidatus Blochmannia ocreatus]URJ25386.1 hypothetical protein M9405_01550 [Candidatus Blochmannia ocreatus]